MEIIQIDVTNACDKLCSNCTRFCGHYQSDRIYFIDPDYYEKALLSLKGYAGIVGMIGGEPTLHPQFPELCELVVKYVPEKKRRGLWSNKGPSFDKYNEIIYETFGYFNLNDHVSNPIIHTPILVASEDLVSDSRLTEDDWKRFTENCWVQMTWSATITPKGAYFCEVAGMLDYLFDGNIGWDIETVPHWWTKNIYEYSRQVEWACRKCGCQLPLRPRRSTDRVDDITVSNLERLKAVESPKIDKGLYELFSIGLDLSQFRDSVWYWNRKKENLLRRAIKKLYNKVGHIFYKQ